VRNASTIAPQSLAMMNGEFTLAQSKFFAGRVAREAGADHTAQVTRAWLLAFGRPPSADELKHSTEFLAKQTAFFQANPVKIGPVAKGKEAPPADAPTQALTTFCQALITSNPFLYVD
jgi:hypothetical protein